jgi:8-oxo-dGTP pyrophosphatase MutT (NUDIX family)
MINGAFTVISFDGKYLFIKRKDKGKWDLPGGGFDVNEIDYKGVTVREIKEETGISTTREDLKLCAILGQRLPERVRNEYKVDFGLIFLHALFLHEDPMIVLSDEHTDYKFFSYSEILQSYKDFSSGPLWEFFTYLKYQETGILQEGILKDRSVWLGQAYV